MTEPAKKKGKALRDFNDAGTGATYQAGKSYDFEPGAHANYLHAGLIADSETSARAG